MRRLPNGTNWYHITPNQNKETILLNGLLPASDGKLFITNSIARALEMWEQMQEENYKARNYASAVLFEIYYTKEIFFDEESDIDCYYITPKKPITNLHVMFEL